MSLREPLRDRVCTAYLFCRLLDLCEDASTTPANSRARLLTSLRIFLSQLKHDSQTLQTAIRDFEDERRKVMASFEIYLHTHAHERELFERASTLLAKIAAFPLPVRMAFTGSLMDMALGMESEVSNEVTRPPRFERSVPDFEQYCYTVAGTVGIFLTQVFWDEGAFETKHTLSGLEKLGESFGEALQIVNITKDFHEDWKEGRCYWPRVLGPGGVGTQPPTPEELAPALEALRRHFDKHIGDAKLYVTALSAKRNDIRFFCDLPLQMAERTMTLALDDRSWLANGDAPKVPKIETLQLVQKLSLVYALPALWKP